MQAEKATLMRADALLGSLNVEIFIIIIYIVGPLFAYKRRMPIIICCNIILYAFK